MYPIQIDVRTHANLAFTQIHLVGVSICIYLRENVPLSRILLSVSACTPCRSNVVLHKLLRHCAVGVPPHIIVFLLFILPCRYSLNDLTHQLMTFHTKVHIHEDSGTKQK